MNGEDKRKEENGSGQTALGETVSGTSIFAHRSACLTISLSTYLPAYNSAAALIASATALSVYAFF
eukprot:6196681-Pleurochrysis_carterae.AAC.1